MALASATLFALALLLLTVQRRPTPTTPPAEHQSVQTIDVAILPEIGTSERWRVEVAMDPETGVNDGVAVAVGPDGRLFVSQPYIHEIHVFGQLGDILRPIGGSGKGPGEFLWVEAIGFTGDTLFATDPRQFRVNYFDPAGHVLGSRRWVAETAYHKGEDEGVTFGPSTPMVLLSNGLALVRPGVFAMGEASPPVGVTSRRIRVPWMVMDSVGQVLDTAGWLERSGTMLGIRRRGFVSAVHVPFQHEPHGAVMPSGGGGIVLVQADNTIGRPAVIVTRAQPFGDTVFQRRFEYTPVPLTDELIVLGMADARVFPDGEDSPRGSDFEGAVRRSGLLPETLPAVEDLAVGQDESIWLRRESLGQKSVAWVVLDGMGKVEGYVTLPSEQYVVAARGTILVTLERDALGRVTLVRYHIAV